MSQYLADYGWLGWILIGLIAGAIAKAIIPGRDPGGCLVTILIGIGGAVLAGFLGQQLGWYRRRRGRGLPRRDRRRGADPVRLPDGRRPRR